MGKKKAFNKEKLIAGIMFLEKSDLDATFKILTRKYGKIDYVSQIYNFDFTEYYNSEMLSSNIKKIFISFDRLVNPERLSDIKIFTNKIEKKFLNSEKGRIVNIDPGLLNLGHIVLATTKPMGHRIALKKGIYGEVTMINIKKEFQPLKWTYADYQDSRIKEDFFKIREIFKKQ
ncbi:MAG: DUF4416 family protein [Spirochaetales bacterium]|nr:DUF4416 family protein [Spirochaetales bacterium]